MLEFHATATSRNCVISDRRPQKPPPKINADTHSTQQVNNYTWSVGQNTFTVGVNIFWLKPLNRYSGLMVRFNSFGVNGFGGGQKIKAQPPLHQRCEGQGKLYTISWSKNDKLPNRGIEPTTASIGVRFKLGEPILAIRARSATVVPRNKVPTVYQEINVP